MSTPTLSVPITEPGVVAGMDDATYHGDPVQGGSLSSTGARRILSSPARFRWELEHLVQKSAFDTGKAVHAEVLGTGAQTVVIPEDLLASNGAASTAAAKRFVADARLDGKVALKAAELAPIKAMAAAVLAHSTARALLERPGIPEASAFAPDPLTGVWLRVRPDFLPDRTDRRTIAVDLKTARSADPRLFRRAVAELGYHQQDALYRDVVRWARGDEDVAFVFVVVETDPPHLVSVCDLDPDALATGRSRNRTAIELYQRCRATDTWPGYGDEIHTIDLPAWATYDQETVL